VSASPLPDTPDTPDTSGGRPDACAGIARDPAARGLLIIANYNQELEIGGLLDRAARCHPVADTVVVDDGSTDHSSGIAEAKGFRILRHDRNRGIGAAIRTGIRHAQSAGYDHVIISSSNGKIQPEEIHIVTAPILDGRAEYVQGSRFMRTGGGENIPTFRRIAIPLFSIGTSILLGRRFTDITCGFRAYRLAMFDDPRVQLDQEWLDRYEMEYYIHWWACHLRLRIVEVPVHIVYGHLTKGRRTKIRPFVDWWSMARPFVYLTLRIRH
jgi:dolichol-phosphate mannosyltransferase